MSQVRTFARQAIETIKAPLPKVEGTLYVEGVPAVRMDDREGVRRLVAGDCLRGALGIGRAACRERGERSVVGVSFKKTRGHTSFDCDWSSDVCSSDLGRAGGADGRSGRGAAARGGVLPAGRL